MDLGEALKKYQELFPIYERGAKDIARLVERVAANYGITCRTSSRAKKLSSFRTKAILKGYDDPWVKITDKAGVRVVVENPRQVDGLVDALQATDLIHVLDVDDKRHTITPGKLGYSGVHLQVAAPSEEHDTPRIDCEIQIRTIAQDAWSVISHSLLYKGHVELPAKQKHAIYRLAALVELFDEEVQRVMDEVPHLPGYEVVELIEAAESEYLGLTHAPSNREFSAHILSQIQDAFSTEERPTYARTLNKYVGTHREELALLYADRGPDSAMASLPNYALFSQAESLVLLERLSYCPYKLIHTWDAAGLPRDMLEPLIDAAGVDSYYPE
ncbi:hypothetical protein [Nonomuraea sp. NPDC050643]|uniref:GTP pyrophosphokinase n=1 Tax=Nonomuraea sp. NPDC050643 TaxID=3155660 RepID=UPI0034025F14